MRSRLSLEINLDAVSKKYDGLDGTELAISESQERMAICVDASEIDYFIAESDKENLECSHVANVTDSGRLVMTWRGKTIVDLSRAFLDTNGVQQSADIHVGAISERPASDGKSLTETLCRSQHLLRKKALARSSTAPSARERSSGPSAATGSSPRRMRWWQNSRC